MLFPIRPPWSWSQQSCRGNPSSSVEWFQWEHGETSPGLAGRWKDIGEQAQCSVVPGLSLAPWEGQDWENEATRGAGNRVHSPWEGVLCRWEHGWRLRHRDLVREKAVQGGTTHTKAEMSGEGGRGCTKGSRERKLQLWTVAQTQWHCLLRSGHQCQ